MIALLKHQRGNQRDLENEAHTPSTIQGLLDKHAEQADTYKVHKSESLKARREQKIIESDLSVTGQTVPPMKDANFYI